MITLAELSPFDRKRERVADLLEQKLFTKQDAADENRAIAREERAARAAERATRKAAR